VVVLSGWIGGDVGLTASSGCKRFIEEIAGLQIIAGGHSNVGVGSRDEHSGAEENCQQCCAGEFW
jgi:hypothetical protein